MPETVLILGASENPTRYSYMATMMLLEYGHKPVLVGKSGSEVMGLPILRVVPEDLQSVDTITLYLNPLHQVAHYDTIISLKPDRVIFNPGTENPEFEQMCRDSGIEVTEACTLVLLSIGNY